MKKYLRILAFVALLTSGLVGCGKAKVPNISEQNKPGTVMIQTVHHAKFSVPEYTLNDSKLEQLFQSLSPRLKNGQLTNQQVVAEAFKAVFNDPLTYFEPQNKRIEEETEVNMTGSAFLVTADGYLVTNAHVVSSEQDNLKETLASNALKKGAEASCDSQWNELDGDFQKGIAGTIGTKEFFQLCHEAHVKYYAHYMSLDELDTQIYAALAASTTRDAIVEEGYKATVEAIGEPTPGKDVAILKIEANNLPTVELESDQSVTPGDRLIPLGYPGAAELVENQIIEPSMTGGVLSARLPMDGGWEVFQTDAAISSGNSGGPVFNENGKVIGVATFGKVDSETGAQIQGANFVIPMDVVEEFLKDADVEPKYSDISQLYQAAVEQYDQKRFKRALKTFRQINELNPNYPYVQSYITKTLENINQVGDFPLAVVIGVGGAAVLLLGAGGVYIWRRHQVKSPKANAN
jgi:S1-C subfamily serine protease